MPYNHYNDEHDVRSRCFALVEVIEPINAAIRHPERAFRIVRASELRGRWPTVMREVMNNHN